MTTDELRQATLDDANAALALPRWALSQARRMRVVAQRSFWSAADAPLDKLLSLIPSEQTMAVVTVSHSIPDDLQAAVEAMGLTWADFLKLAETDGPLVWKVLQDLYVLFVGGHLSGGKVGGPFVTWLLTVGIPTYGPVAIKVIKIVLPLLGIVL